MFDLIDKLQRAGKLDIRVVNDSFALRVPRHDEHTGELLDHEERAVDLDALIAQRIQVQQDLVILNAVIAMLTDMKEGRT